MALRKTAKRAAAPHPGRAQEDWTNRVVGTKAFTRTAKDKQVRTPNLGDLVDYLNIPERNEGSKEQRRARWKRKNKASKEALMTKRGRP